MIGPSGPVMRFAFITLYAVSVVDVVLDPDTAHPNIVLSADGKQAGRGELLQIVPDNPKRFDPVICVVAKKGFLSGRFYFQVRLFVHLPESTAKQLISDKSLYFMFRVASSHRLQ